MIDIQGFKKYLENNLNVNEDDPIWGSTVIKLRGDYKTRFIPDAIIRALQDRGFEWSRNEE